MSQISSLRTVVGILIPVIVCLLTVSCGSVYYETGDIGYVENFDPNEKVEVEAFLFDAKLRRDGKPTSFRLDLYLMDSSVALSGRGYLGKGALKGRLTADSIEVYFPATNEYIYESISSLLSNSECKHGTVKLDFLSLLRKTPDQVDLGPEAILLPEISNKKHRSYILSWPDCGWQVELKYNFKKIGWRLKEFTFDNGKNQTLKAKCRVHKNSAKVKQKKLHFNIPADAFRITP